MCGIYGYYDRSRAAIGSEVLDAMAAAIRHRGPDGSGRFDRPGGGVALGSERLAILDPANGSQPMHSGRAAIVQNGEVFNHRDLAAQLRLSGVHLDTSCDTEVLLAMYERDGVEAVRSFNGMFAIAIYDQGDDALLLIRDRLGEKPLFYFDDGTRFVFGSEPKAILAATGELPVDEVALAQYLTFNYVPPPLTIHRGIRHVLPGHWLRVDRSGVLEVRYWDLADREARARTAKDWAQDLDELLEDSVRLRLDADVDVGAFLSGGVDSSSVVAHMARLSSGRVPTFSIGFGDSHFDESAFSERAATRFDTDHHLRHVDATLVDDWPRVLRHCDQPHGDASFMPTLSLAELAADAVTVVLTGDGADELFAGYDTHRRYFDGRPDRPVDERYLDAISLFDARSLTALAGPAFRGDPFAAIVAPILDRVPHFDSINRALFVDTTLLLPGNNLVKPDRLGMAAGIENRSPYLDHRLVELAFEIPGHLKLRAGETKHILKQTVAPLIGDDLAMRPKQMFTVPIGEWLKSSLNETARSLLIDTPEWSGFSSGEIDRMLTTHRSEQANYTRELRALMAFELWLRERPRP